MINGIEQIVNVSCEYVENWEEKKVLSRSWTMQVTWCCFSFFLLKETDKNFDFIDNEMKRRDADESLMEFLPVRLDCVVYVHMSCVYVRRFTLVSYKKTSMLDKLLQF